jgi:deoxyribonuclease-4
VERGGSLGCTAIQVFTRNQRRWRAKPLSDGEAARFAAALDERRDIRVVLAHGSYLCNPASPDGTILLRSRESLSDELSRCARLGIPVLIIHPGAHRGRGVRWGIRRVVRSLVEVLSCDRTGVTLCLETTAGQGTAIGHRLEHLHAIIEGVESACGSGRDRLGVCLDTSHLFAAGYDIRGEALVDGLLEEFDARIGMDRLRALHLNDSLGDLGSRRDRHTHIGRGRIGVEAFGRLMRHPALREVPKIIETPKRLGDEEMDPINLSLLRRLAEGERP